MVKKGSGSCPRPGGGPAKADRGARAILKVFFSWLFLTVIALYVFWMGVDGLLTGAVTTRFADKATWQHEPALYVLQELICLGFGGALLYLCAKLMGITVIRLARKIRNRVRS